MDTQLRDVLSRKIALPALEALIEAISPSVFDIKIEEAAIAIDSSVFLRLSNHAKSADITDYLGAAHRGPLILPGQSIQEFWNNQLNAVDTVVSSLQSKFDLFKEKLNEVDPNFGNYASRIDEVLEEFSLEHGHVYDRQVVVKTVRLLEVLKEKAIVPFVCREKFGDIGDQRNRTKTPPGFRDKGDGDFYIWLDTLRGLQIAKAKKIGFKKIVIVTEDVKVDWSRAGMPHPILAAEASALFGVPFELWKLDRLAAEVAARTTS